ncbi:MAG: oligosaccharide flippase family protein, partial [Armatimonadetes bacterium]|nr:oligosaccharide flippase family protein [Armatimonadota bacterium]
FLGANMLGFYALAYNISSLPSMAISQILAKVSFPLYSKLQEDQAKLKEAFLNFFLLNIILILPISLGIYILAYPLIINVLGIKWMPMLGVLKILCIFGFLRSLGGITGVVFNSLGRPGELKKLVLIHVILMSISIFPLGLKWGIEGVGISVVISQFINIYFAFIKLKKLINFNWREIFKINLIPFSASFLLVIFLVILKYFIKDTLLNFLIIIISGSIFYLGLIYLFKKEWYFKIWNLIKGLEF